jgi:presenilin-like A22 family membrane protease
MSEATSETTESAATADAGVSLPDFVPTYGTYALATVAMVLGVLVAPALAEEGLRAYQNPGSGLNLLKFAGAVAVGTLSILLVERYGYGKLAFRVLFVGIFAYEAALLTSAFLDGAFYVALIPGVLTFLALWYYPEWYVVDVAGIVFCAAFAGMFGISLVPGLVVALLVLFAAYDAYSVYVSEHMQSLVDGSLDMAIPMGFLVPGTTSFSLLDVEDMGDLAGGDGESSVSFLGYGDAIIPGMLAVSAGHFLADVTDPLISGVAYLNAPALGALVGGVVGTVGLHVLITKVERAHPALIVLNPATIGGYLLGALYAGVSLSRALDLGLLGL